ncbi:uncharacterized protein LOC115078334 isoform X2 [Rhinatrema bivittatum]|uniref:uncharacterized protein LOC115078334 isoform X2 n=1 Tax=Rhinatrema bivittatum TaxID=194408 RepID=UPI00112D5DC6|nr:uncharacterized protein LOC115078334 isoform X2 [Rhinatrema bivittatum]
MSSRPTGRLDCPQTLLVVRAQEGGSTLLPCSFTWTSPVPPPDKKAVWQREREGAEDEVVTFRNGVDSEDRPSAAFAARAHVPGSWFERGNASLALYPVTPADAGNYRCLLLTYPLGPHALRQCSEVRLEVFTEEGPGSWQTGEGCSCPLPSAEPGVPTGNEECSGLRVLLASGIFFVSWVSMILFILMVLKCPKALQNSSPKFYAACLKDK